MKKTTNFMAYMSIFCLLMLSSCDSNKEKTAEAESSLNKAENDLSEAKLNEKSDSIKLVSVEEWALFKQSTESQIEAHEIRIAFLKKSLKQSQTKESKELMEKINSLEAKNKTLKSKLESYEKVQSDWISFKREFAFDMDQLGKSLKDFTIPNKK